MASKKLYELTPEHRAQLKPWADRWIANAMSTAPMTEADREICRDAVARLYRAAKLEPPPRERIVFVPSPFVLRFAGGYAAGIWHQRRAATREATWDATTAATREATWDATRAATEAATRDATWDATTEATWAATRAATRDATRDATWNATTEATWAATRAATRDATTEATWDATRAAAEEATTAATEEATEEATRAATTEATRDDNWWHPIVTGCWRNIAVSPFLISCAQNAWRMWQGGNQWSGYDSYLGFFRHIAKLKLPQYEAWDCWETLSLHSGPRIMHRDFCMISDRPEILTVDDESRPHADNAPFCRWRDGTALYAVHGVRVPWWLIERPERLTADRITSEENSEVRRVMIDRYGAGKYLSAIAAERLDHEEGIGTLFRSELPDDEPLVMVEVVNSSPEPDGEFKHYWLRVPPEMRTARAAVAWTFGMSETEYRPMIET